MLNTQSHNLLAQVTIAPNGGFKGIGTGTLANPGAFAANPETLFAKVISSAIGLISIIGIIWFVFILILGAIGIMSAGGDKQALESAKKKISTGLIGLVVVIVGLFILDLIGFLLGFGLGGILDITTLFSYIQ